jgi:hypothetical protein
MPYSAPAVWSDHLRQTLQAYGDSVLREVAANLVRPRSQWPSEELMERSIHTLHNAAVIDRRLHDLDVPSRRLLGFIAHSRQPRWKLGNLLELLAAVGHSDGLQAVLRLFESGLLYPNLGAQAPWRAGPTEADSAGKSAPSRRLKSFEQWLGQGASAEYAVFALPQVIERALDVDLGFPELPSVRVTHGSIHEADGLEWPLRLAAIWQLIGQASLRRTQGGDFFKRDLDRLRTDPLLNGAPVEDLMELPDVGLLAVELGQIEGLIEVDSTELKAGVAPAAWEEGLASTLSSLWSALPFFQHWNPHDGWYTTRAGANPYPSACLLALLLLGRVPEDRFVRLAEIERWVLEHHPFWGPQSLRRGQKPTWVRAFLLGYAYQLRMLQATKDSKGDWVVRLSPYGRWLAGLGAQPPVSPFGQTLLVQPNLEILVYRQGLTPGLIARLSRFASWKTLGSACTLQLQADMVYRALESGLTFEAIVQTLEQSATRATPPAVVESLRTWAGKRDRISVYPAATLFEFGNADDLNEALARGLPGVRLSDRLLAVAGEEEIDFRHFRLTSTRDYGLPPEKCVEVQDDGVTLAIDLSRSDLLLETELQRFAEPQADAALTPGRTPGADATRLAMRSEGKDGRTVYRVTPQSLAAGQSNGLELRELEDWFQQRTGRSLSPAVKLLLTGDQAPPLQVRRQLILHVATPEIADGLEQWPATHQHIKERIGPTALVIDEEDMKALAEKLRELGMTTQAE